MQLRPDFRFNSNGVFKLACAKLGTRAASLLQQQCVLSLCVQVGDVRGMLDRQGMVMV